MNTRTIFLKCWILHTMHLRTEYSLKRAEYCVRFEGLHPQFYVEPPWIEGTKVCSRHPDHMNKMTATPMYGKNPSKIFYETVGLTLTYFMVRSNFVT